MKTCFSIMPFEIGFQEIDHILDEAANSAGLRYVRGDLSKRPGSILAQIVSEIRQAAVVVADITDAEPIDHRRYHSLIGVRFSES